MAVAASQSCSVVQVRALVSHWRRIAGDTNPVSILVKPRVDKSFPPDIRLSLMTAFGCKDANGNSSLPEHAYADGFRCNLFLICGWRFETFQELGLCIDGSVVLHQNDRIIKYRTKGLCI